MSYFDMPQPECCKSHQCTVYMDGKDGKSFCFICFICFILFLLIYLLIKIHLGINGRIPTFHKREEEKFHNSIFLQQTFSISQNPTCTFVYHKWDT